MKRTLADLASAFAQKTSDEYSANWKLFFQFWKAPIDSVSIIRFLPDLDEDNPLGFLVQNKIHELHINGKREIVPCLKMYDEECPVCALSAKYYNKSSSEFNETIGKKYYRKISYIGQIIILETPIEHDQEQIVKLIDFGPKIYQQIRTAFQSGDLEEPPYELKGGYNFRIKKTKSGEYADYGTSSFSPKQTDVADDVIEMMKLYNLVDYRTPKISRELLEAMLLADQTNSSFESDSDSELEDEEISSIKNKEDVIHVSSIPETKIEAKVEVEKLIEKSIEKQPEKKLSVVEQLRARAAAAKAAQA